MPLMNLQGRPIAENVCHHISQNFIKLQLVRTYSLDSQKDRNLTLDSGGIGSFELKKWYTS